MSQVDYNPFSKTFALSRDRQKRPEAFALLEEVIRHRGTKFSVLDVGCGGGHLIPILQSLGWSGDYLGTDSSEGMIREAKKRFPEFQFEIRDMRSEIGDQKCADVIFFIASFHHLLTEAERITVLSKFASKLAPHGIIAMTNWDLLSPKNLAKYGEVRQAGTNDFLVPIASEKRLYHAFTSPELKNLGEQSGLKLLKQWDDGGRNILSVFGK